MRAVSGETSSKLSPAPSHFACLKLLLITAGRLRCFGDDATLLRLRDQTGYHEGVCCLRDTRDIATVVLPRAITGAQLVDGTTTCLHHFTGRCIRTDILFVGHTVIIVILFLTL